MTNEELERTIDLEDFNRDKMKDDIHHLYEENKQLKEKLDLLYKTICINHDSIEINLYKRILEIVGDKE